MFRYTTWYVNVISLIISSIIFCFTNFFISNNCFIGVGNFFYSKTEFDNQSDLQIPEKDILISKENNSEDAMNSELLYDEKWCIEIPKIALKAYIEEGTSKEVMDNYVGHFEETSKFDGNIGLAAHNRGYKNNYFQNLKELREDDIVYYFFNGNSKKFIVIDNFIIEDTDWSVFNETEENMLTLITCVENEPSYRRCVQAKEILE